MIIVSRKRILDEYTRIYNEHKNDVPRFAAVARILGLEIDQVIKTVRQALTETENV